VSPAFHEWFTVRVNRGELLPLAADLLGPGQALESTISRQRDNAPFCKIRINCGPVTLTIRVNGGVGLSIRVNGAVAAIG
jgi:hypothetical protein